MLHTIYANVTKCNKTLDLSEVNNILVVKLDEIGDVVMASPFLRELRKNCQNSNITLVVKNSTYNLVEACPYVDNVIKFNSKPLLKKFEEKIKDTKFFGLFKSLSSPNDSPDIDRRVAAWLPDFWRDFRALRLAHSNLWRRRFDLAILPRWGVDQSHAAAVMNLSGASWRVGYSSDVSRRKRMLNSRLDRLFSHAVNDRLPRHEVEYNLRLIEFIGGKVENRDLEVWTSVDDEKFADNALSTFKNGGSRPKVVICPGAGDTKRRWPCNRFAEMGKDIQSMLGAQIVIVGGPEDGKLARYIEERINGDALNMAGKASLRETAAVIRRCDAYVGNDTGPMHLAAAVGTPVVEISCHPKTGDVLHYNSPSRFGPWRVDSKVLQPKKARDDCVNGCYAEEPHCILEVSVEQVCDAVELVIK